MKHQGAAALLKYAIAASLFLASPTAAGQAAETKACGAAGAPWIRLQAESLSAELRAAVLTHVRSSLAARESDLCVSDEQGPSPPIAILKVIADGDGGSTKIGVDDGVTKKMVVRELELGAVPADGRALTLALALDELLRASWAELLLADAQPAAPPPPAVTRAITASLPEIHPSSKRWELGIAFGGDHYAEGQDQLGPGVRVAVFPWSRLGFHARFDVRFGFRVEAIRGDITSTALLGGLGVDVALVPRTGRAGVELLGELTGTRVTFTASPSMAGVHGNEKTLGAAYGLVGMRGWLVIIPPLRAFIEGGVGAPLHTAYANDGDVRITGLAGFLLTGEVGLATVF